MDSLTIELPAREDQTAFNLRRWEELCSDPELAKVEGRIETDRHGHIIMYPIAAFSHGSYQSEIAYFLRIHLPHGRTVVECPISTADGVKGADVAWISHVRLAEIGEGVCLPAAPEICVEVLSPDNTRAEMREKKALYFAAGASEVWFCDRKGRMTFHGTADSAGDPASGLCPDFPGQVEL
ncbi:MAG TPA: Uma2 family endonuclease [Chthoniobacteraceae bacterium]|jgi:Uma2 family endonuclease|nr:Uma2 family endonuclease [Chthoniobacteraceae bacterium]